MTPPVLHSAPSQAPRSSHAQVQNADALPQPPPSRRTPAVPGRKDRRAPLAPVAPLHHRRRHLHHHLLRAAVPHPLRLHGAHSARRRLPPRRQAESRHPTPGGLLPSANIHRGDIIVFHYPVDPEMHLVKRVVGIPGDHLKLRAGRVYINGAPPHEPYAVYRPSAPDNFRDNFPRLQSADPDIDSRWWIRMRTLIDNGELIIPAGNYFVLGDNRNDSEDSRYWGFVPRADIVGKPLLIYFSLRQRPTPRRSDIPLTWIASATRVRSAPGPLDSLAGFARWSRTFQIVK